MRWLALLLLFPASAQAADRTYSVGSFERVRVEGPFEVRIVTGASPGAKASGDQALVDQLDIVVTGTVLVVRMGHRGWGERPVDAPTRPATITLSTPRLSGAAINAGARVTIGAMKAQRVDLSVTGAGTLTVAGADADDLVGSVVGAGTLSISGRAARARLLVNGPGDIAASALTVNDLIVRTEGDGEVAAAARFTAQVTTTGLGKVTIAGAAKCIVKAVAGGPVACGRPAS